MSQVYYKMTDEGTFPQYFRGGGGRADLSANKPVLGKIGRTSAPKGFVQTGTTTRSNKAGSQTFAIYTPLDQIKPQEPTTTTDTDTDTDTSTDTDTDTGTSNVVTNPYQSQIDDLTTTLGTISGQIGGYTETINSLRGQMQTMQTEFGNQLKGIMDANAKALEDMSTQYQTQLREQQEAQELARQQRELAAQTAAANQARAGQQAEFQLGTPMLRGIFGGLAGFKRRGKVKAQASGALAIAATEGQTKSPNKMLNV